jgi:GTP-binding protein Era
VKPSGSDKKRGTASFLSGFVSITGRPNVGKSTFLNAVLGQKISIVTAKPQTTRNRIIGIKTIENAQIIFIDTPGIHRPKHGLGAAMVREARRAIKDVDVVLYMVEPKPPSKAEMQVIKLFEKLGQPVLLVINKIDTVKKPDILPVIEAYRGLYAFEEVIPISALKGEGLDVVLDVLMKFLEPGPKYYPDELVTDRLERFMVSEIIREKIMEATEEEIPHSVAIEITGWEEREGGAIVINANIYVEKKSQKGIIIGGKGATLKSIGTRARGDIEGLLGTKVFLELWVKVRKSWRDDKAALMELGFE